MVAASLTFYRPAPPHAKKLGIGATQLKFCCFARCAAKKLEPFENERTVSAAKTERV